MTARLGLLALLAVVAFAGSASLARADGDPGSDVLVAQNLFVASDAGASVNQQVQLGGLLQAADRAGFPIRVAIIASRDDLGAVTPLWLKPRSYARFLGIELSLSYKQRLLVVMPNGFGFSWPGHSTASGYAQLARVPIKSGGNGLLAAAALGVRTLAAEAGLKLTSHTPVANAAGTAPQSTSSSPRVPAAGTSGAAATAPGASGDNGIRILIGMTAFVLAGLTLRTVLRRRRRRARSRGSAEPDETVRPGGGFGLRWAIPGVAVLAAVAATEAIAAILSESSPSSASALATNPYLDPGTSLLRPAPDFTLSDQFGQRESLRSFRGKVVILDFNDSECTTICPLTTTAMADAKQLLGAAGSQVQLLGVDANPKATAIEDVLSYSQLHGMLHDWHFLTGSLSQLRRVWKAYGIQAEIEHGLISHTPALFVIDPEGRLRKLYVTQQSYTAVGQFGQLLAQEASDLLPDHPSVKSHLTYAQIPGITPSASVTLPRAGGGTIRLGPSASPRLFVFFATWDQEVTSLGGQLDALNRYQSSAAAAGLPALTAVDEGSVEPSSAALPRFLAGLPHPLSYPVAIDQTGRVADGYEVQGEPWLMLTSPAGRILWYHEVYTSGWLSSAALQKQVRDALARAPKPPASTSAAERELVGSPAPLAALHAQASRLLGSEPALAARVRALLGYPIVVNVWASWCAPCQAEFGLFANASAHYGRQVAFLGADTDDTAGDAESFLAQHHVSYPSYQDSSTQLQGLLPGGLEGLPTTIYINGAGKVVNVHTGQYDSQGTLDADIGSYATAN
jgi:cytochrome oxidase Cu insertion factor (SCO1/SenC/PrrC family)/thiol-disulfide isomerase/thioredoxin